MRNIRGNVLGAGVAAAIGVGWALWGRAADAAGTTPVEDAVIRSSGGGEFDFEQRTATYYGDVRVVLPGGFEMTCERLISDLPTDEKPLQRIQALTNVVIDIVQPARKPGAPPRTIHAVCGEMVFNATNRVVALMKDPKLVLTEVTVTCNDTIYYDLGTGRISWKGVHQSRFNPEAIKKSDLFKSLNTNSTPTGGDRKPAK